MLNEVQLFGGRKDFRKKCLTVRACHLRTRTSTVRPLRMRMALVGAAGSTEQAATNTLSVPESDNKTELRIVTARGRRAS